jgi:peptidase M23-like protein
MATNSARLYALRLAVVLAALCFLSCAWSAAASAQYGWPVKPFDRQHPVRGFFGDPRIDGRVRQFHFGVDVSAPDGTAVYATLTGRVYVEPQRPETVAIRSDDTSVVFSYWHLVPLVRTGQRAVAYKTVIGRIARGWGHVHFSESRDGRYLNPLRLGAMTPFADTVGPVIRALQVERRGRVLAAEALSGSVDLVVDAFDRTPLRVAAPWRDLPVMPTGVRWRILRAGHATTPWKTAVDFRTTIPPAAAFSNVFALWTRQNHPNRAGRYRVYLVRGWKAPVSAGDECRVQVVVTDARGNTASMTRLLRLAA